MRNWIKLGIIVPARTNPFRFDPRAINDFRRGAMPGSEKLTRRANKSRSTKRSLHGRFRRPGEMFLKLRLRHSTAVYLAALKILELSGEVQMDGAEPVKFTRDSVKSVMMEWKDRLRTAPDERAAAFYESLDWVFEEELLGEFHQALLTIGSRARYGTYYTKPQLIESALSWGQGAKSFLDPCCGTGRYLVRAGQLLQLSPDQIFGIERDPVAADIARVNLLLAFPGQEFIPNIYCKDALSIQVMRGKYRTVEFIATNPPWGAVQKGREESFNLFIHQALRFLSEEGRMSFLLPEAILNIKAHSELRRHLLENCTIQNVEHLGRCFPGVFTGVVRLDARKGRPGPEHRIRIYGKGMPSTVVQNSIAACRDYMIETSVNDDDRDLVDKLMRGPHHTLAGNAAWALGIVTGDNAGLLATTPEPGTEPIYRGCDIFANQLGPPRRWLRPGPLQQAAPMSIYRSPVKIIYRFIAKHPVCYVDREQKLTLNSANVLIPKIHGWTPELTARYLNSRLIGYLYEKRFNTFKILRKDLELLPFPALDGTLVDALNRADSEEFEKRIYKLFDLTEEEIALIESSIS